MFFTAHEYLAVIARDVLENEGIKAIIMNQHDSAYQTFGEISVFVEEKDEKKALELLKELKN